jgi:hypothetical protein
VGTQSLVLDEATGLGFVAWEREAVVSSTSTPRGRTMRIRVVPAWLGLGLYAGYCVVRAIAGLGGGGLAPGSVSLPDAPNRPGLLTGIGGTAGSVGSVASSGPGGALLCRPRRRAGVAGDYEPDLEDEILWRSLRRAVPALDGWDRQRGSPADPVRPGDADGDGGSQSPSIHGFGDEPPTDGPDGEVAGEAMGDSGASIHGFGDGATGGDESAGGPDPARERGEEDLPPPIVAREESPSSVMTLIRTRPCASMALVGLVVSLIALVGELVYLGRLANPTVGNIMQNATYGAWTVGWMMVATMAVRTFRLRDVVRFWLVGFFAAAGVVSFLGIGITTAMAPGLLRTAIVVPVVEEVVKALLLLAFLLVAVRSRGREPSIVDLMIVGFALGAAFGVHEDGLWVRLLADGFGAGWGSLFPVYVWDPVVVVAHAGWTALAGLGLGLAWHLRRHRWAWILAVVPLALAIFDHVSINLVLSQAAEGVTRGAGWTMRAMTGHGSLVAQVVLLGFVAAAVVDWLALRRRLAVDPLPAWSTLPGIRANVRALPGLRAKLLGALLLLGERRAHLGARYARVRTEPRPEATAPPA